MDGGLPGLGVLKDGSSLVDGSLERDDGTRLAGRSVRNSSLASSLTRSTFSCAYFPWWDLGVEPNREVEELPT